jgi:hypothetical protein
VLAVYEHAAVLALEPCGRLLTLVDRGRPLVPFGIEVPLAEVTPETGQRATLRSSGLQLGPDQRIAFVGPGVSLAWWNGPFSRVVLGHQLDGLVLPQRTRALLEERSTGTGPMEQADARAAQGLHRLVEALFAPQPDRAAIAEQVRGLSGLGPGTTPTGDDLLTGLTACTLRLARAGATAEAGAGALCEAIEALPPTCTTPVARAMLAHAVAGQFVEPLGTLVSGLGNGDHWDLVAPAVTALGTVGAQTGSDMLAGVMALATAVRRSPGGWA